MPVTKRDGRREEEGKQQEGVTRRDHNWNNTLTRPLFHLSLLDLYFHLARLYRPLQSAFFNMDTPAQPTAKPELKDTHGLEASGDATADVVDLEQKFGYLQELPRVGSRKLIFLMQHR